MGKYSHRTGVVQKSNAPVASKQEQKKSPAASSKVEVLKQKASKEDFGSLGSLTPQAEKPSEPRLEDRHTAAKVGATIAASVVVAVVLLTALGVTQAIARKFVAKTSGLLSTVLERIAKMGSFARWKSKKCAYPVMRGSSLILWKSAIPLYDFLSLTPVLIDARSGVAHTMQDFDAKEMFEVETDILSERVFLADAESTEEGEILHFVGATTDCWLRLPTVSELYHYQEVKNGN